MTFFNYRQQSRDVQWGTEAGDEWRPSLDQINCGSLLRIADATEKMALRYTELIDNRDYWKRRAERAEASLDTERRRSRALKAIVKRRKA